MSNKTFSDFGVTEDAPEYEKESQQISKFKNGDVFKITAIEFKKLGTRDGAVMEVATPVTDVDGENWTKIHTANKITLSKLNKVELGQDDILEVKVKTGKTDNGTWYDIV